MRHVGGIQLKAARLPGAGEAPARICQAILAGADVYSVGIIVAAFVLGLGVEASREGGLADRIAARWGL
jgi:hypothetical protein